MTPAQQAFFDTSLKVLNEALAADPACIEIMVKRRCRCNDALANHPTIQVALDDDPPTTYVPSYLVGILGLLNGVIEAATGERVAAVFDESGALVAFTQYQRL